MLDATVEKAINEQIRKEYYSSYLYLSMAAYYESQNLGGFAHWVKKQAQEELEHALKFFDYVNDRGGRVVLEAIDKPPVEFASPLAAFEQILEHEQAVTRSIYSVYEVAVGAKDYASQSLLKWFIDEQVEEEKNASEIVARLKMSGQAGHALVMMDRALAAR